MTSRGAQPDDDGIEIVVLEIRAVDEMVGKIRAAAAAPDGPTRPSTPGGPRTATSATGTAATTTRSSARP